MLNSVIISNATNMTFELPFGDVSSGYSVIDISGLDPVRANITTSAYATMDGEEYHSARRDKRNIVIELGMELGYTNKSIRELRNYLYNFFMPKMPVVLKFVDNQGFVYSISGRVESFTAPLFSKDPRASISILCFDPDFQDLNPVIFSGSTVSNTSETIHEYAGTTPTGVVFEITPNRAMEDLIFYQTTNSGFVRSLTLDMDFLSGDTIKISTVPGDKYVSLNRDGLETSILYALGTASTWPLLQPGSNRIRIFTEGAAIPYTITYTNKFGGL